MEENQLVYQFKLGTDTTSKLQIGHYTAGTSG